MISVNMKDLYTALLCSQGDFSNIFLAVRISLPIARHLVKTPVRSDYINPQPSVVKRTLNQ